MTVWLPGLNCPTFVSCVFKHYDKKFNVSKLDSVMLSLRLDKQVQIVRKNILDQEAVWVESR